MLRQLLWPSEPEASLLLVLFFLFPFFLAWRLRMPLPSGAVFWGSYIPCCVLLTTAMLLGLAPRTRPAALRAMTAVVVAWFLGAAWGVLAHRGTGLSFTGILLLGWIGAQIIDWWAAERAAAVRPGSRDSHPGRIRLARSITTRRVPSAGAGDASAAALAVPAIPRVTRRKPLRIATWNINSVRLRRPLLAALVAALDPDVLCLQETKCPDEHFPADDLRAFGFPHVAHRGMKGYNGVAILSRLPFTVRDDDPNWCERGDCRHLGVELDTPGGPIELHDFYVPAGGDTPDRDANPKFAHKLDFVAEAAAWTARRGPARRGVLVGDLNIAPREHDVWSHRQMQGVISHTPVEIAALDHWQASGAWHDALRHFVPDDQKLYTWWSYRARDWEAADRGRRLDHVWVSQDLAGALTRHAVLKPARGWPQASDHVPVMVELAV